MSPLTRCSARCSVSGCTRPRSARGWCATHYERWRRNGDLLLHLGLPAGTRRLDKSGYFRIKSPGHPLAWRGLDWVHEHRAVLYNEIGPGPHSCHWCGVSVDWRTDLVVDHLDGARLRNEPANLVPSCGPCNLHRETPVVCILCAEPLTGRRSDSLWCSGRCRGRAARGEPAPGLARSCRNCDEPLRGKRSDARYCSEGCRSAWRRGHAEGVIGRNPGCSLHKAGQGSSAEGPGAFCSCADPLPAQRGEEPWRCDLCSRPLGSEHSEELLGVAT